ncbi:transposase family protein, partial [Klebsiella pneumoniae]|nr:transposase family protein [Klebsiella pneumoniae]
KVSGSKFNVRKFTQSPKKFGPKRILKSKDEFLLTLMKLRLGCLNKDLADRFDISESLVCQIFHSWLTAMSKILSNL